MTNCKWVVFLLFAFVLADARAAQMDDYGNYILHYTDARGQPQTWIFTPANKVAPRVASTLTAANGIQYEYTVSNGAAAVQPIQGFEFVSPVPWAVSNSSPAIAEAPAGFSAAGGDYGSRQFGFRWRSEVVTGRDLVTIQPGQTFSGLKVQLPYLAGILNAKVFGYLPPRDASRVPDNLDEDGVEIESPELDAQTGALMDNDGADVLIPGPLISLVDVSDFGTIAVSIKNEVARWPTIEQASPAFVGPASQRLDVLADALTRRNASAANAAAADLENLIAATPAADLSPLGAYVLRFDLRETLRRSGTYSGRPPPPIR